MLKINTFIIGAQKAGTTSLYYYLQQHPEIYFSEVKEVTYFVDDYYYNKGEQYLHSFFRNYNDEKIVASSYVEMLGCKNCPERVQRYNPDMKFIAILRNPVKRAYSAYRYAIQKQWQDPGVKFLEALERDFNKINHSNKDKIENKKKYVYNGLYYRHLKHWLKFFPRNQFLILNFSHLIEHPHQLLSEIFEFLDIDSSVQVNTNKQYNKTGRSRFRVLQALLNQVKGSKMKALLGKLSSNRFRLWITGQLLPKVKDWNTIKEPYRPLTSQELQYASQYFKDDMQHLEKEFGIKFTYRS
jgi:hypothetical protein